MVVTGGVRSDSGGEGLDTVQVYQYHKWTEASKMPEKLWAHCQATVEETVIVTGNNGCYLAWVKQNSFSENVLLAGGFKENSSGSASAYQLKDGVWTALVDMRTPRWMHACAMWKNELYVVGGSDTGIVEIFHMSTQTWRYGPRLPPGMDYYYGQVVVMRQKMFFIDRTGTVVRIAVQQWQKVAHISGWSFFRPLSPALVVTSDILYCES